MERPNALITNILLRIKDELRHVKAYELAVIAEIMFGAEDEEVQALNELAGRTPPKEEP